MGTFKDSLKKWFYTNNTNAASSDARIPLLNANGTPKGSDTIANISSVLNGIAISLTNQNNLNDVVDTGVYSWLGSSTAPLNNFRAQGSLLLVWKAGTQTFQLQWPNTFSSVGIGFRIRWNGEWSAWNKILLSSDQ